MYLNMKGSVKEVYYTGFDPSSYNDLLKDYEIIAKFPYDIKYFGVIKSKNPCNLLIMKKITSMFTEKYCNYIIVIHAVTNAFEICEYHDLCRKFSIELIKNKSQIKIILKNN